MCDGKPLRPPRARLSCARHTRGSRTRALHCWEIISAASAHTHRNALVSHDTIVGIHPAIGFRSSVGKKCHENKNQNVHRALRLRRQPPAASPSRRDSLVARALALLPAAAEAHLQALRSFITTHRAATAKARSVQSRMFYELGNDQNELNENRLGNGHRPPPAQPKTLLHLTAIFYESYQV